MKQSSVFEKYAHEYDLVTNAAQRESYHRKEIEAIIARFKPTRVLDAGCGTGLTTCLFAKASVEAVGLDRSRAMIEQARKKYGGLRAPLSFRVGRFERLPGRMRAGFDLVVCLANSISGLHTQAELQSALENFNCVLRPGGTLLIQALNHQAVPSGRFLPIKVTENDGLVWARYARREGRRWAVHVVRIDLNRSPIAVEPFCHESDLFSASEIRKCLKAAGFGKLKTWADLYLRRPFTRSSRDLVIVGTRPQRAESPGGRPCDR